MQNMNAKNLVFLYTNIFAQKVFICLLRN